MDKFVFLVVLLLYLPNSYAWKWDTHFSIVESVYYSMPNELQSKVNFSRMKEGSVAPDKNFKDFKKHSYPASLILAKKWLSDKSDMAYNFGVASHYISDSFVAAHNIAGEDYNDHERFEITVLKYKPEVECRNYNLNLDRDLVKATESKKDWGFWLKTKDKKIVQKEVDNVMRLIYSISLDYFNYTCRQSTKVTNEGLFTNKRDIIKAAAILLFGLPLLYFFKD